MRKGSGTCQVWLKCDGCRAVFQRYRSDAKKAAAHYCGLACKRAAHKGATNPKWRGGRVQTTCPHCSATFSKDPGSLKRFCSSRCGAKARRIHATARDGIRDGRRRREARERATRKDLGRYTELEWQAILREHDYACAYCKRQDNIERDHIIPLSKGGSDMADNIQPLCGTCNRKKNAKLGPIRIQLELAGAPL